MPEVLERPISIALGLSGSEREYLLLREDQATETLQKLGVRRWKVTSKRQAQSREPRAGVRRGELPDEMVLTISDWSKGIGGVGDTRPGIIFKSLQCNGFVPGTLRANAEEALLPYTTTRVAAIDPTSEITIPIVFNSELFVFSGRYATRYDNQGTATLDKDFGVGVRVIDAIVWNSELVVGLGPGPGATLKIQSRNTAGTWTAATDNTFVDHFAIVQDRLWDVIGNSVRNIASSANPLTLANHSAGIVVGDVTTGATDLNALGVRALVSKPEGLFPGDAAAVFPNVLPTTVVDPDNGKNTGVVGSTVFYRYRGGVVMWQEGRSPVEVGLNDLRHVQIDATNNDTVGTRFQAFAAQGEYLWATTAPALNPASDVISFFKTTDNGVGYTDYSAAVTDNDRSTTASLSALDIVTNGDWVVVGTTSPSVLSGLYFEMVGMNSNASLMTASYWNGSAWVAIPLQQDLTVSPLLATPSARGTATLSRSGAIYWSDQEWASSSTSQTINSVTGHFIRLNFSVALSTGVAIAEVRYLKSNEFSGPPVSWIFRGRRAKADDITDKPIVWEPYGYLIRNWLPTGLAVVDQRIYPFVAEGALVVAGNAEWRYFPLPRSASTVGPYQSNADSIGAAIWTPFYDFGSPSTQKVLTSIRIRAQGVDAGNYISIGLYKDTSTGASDTVATDNSDVVSYNGVDFYWPRSTFTLTSFQRMRMRIEFGRANTDEPQILEMIELTIQELPVMKSEYEMILYVADDTYNADGGELPDAKVQLTNLEALRGGNSASSTSSVLIDPIGRNKTVTVYQVDEIEVIPQQGRDMPGLAVLVRCTEE